MATPVVAMRRRVSQSILWILAVLSHYALSDFDLYDFKAKDVLFVVESACLFVGSQPVSREFRQLLEQLSSVYVDEDGVVFGTMDTENFRWPGGAKLQWKHSDIFPNFERNTIEVVFLRKKEVDRNCLTKPKHVVYPMAEVYDGPLTVAALVPFINSVCGTFRDFDGQISSAGVERTRILQNLFHVQFVSQSNMGTIYSTKQNPLNQSYVWHQQSTQDTCDVAAESCRAQAENAYRKPTSMPMCKTVDHEMSRDEFVNIYLKRSKPVIFKKSIIHWPAFKKWSNDFFKTKHGDRKVHIKLTPTGDFEGVEKSELWEDYKDFKIPDHVLKQLLYPDLVVVRPAHDEMRMSDFIDLINKTAFQSHRNVSAYLEYSSIKDIVEELEKDVKEPEFMKRLLNLKHMNIWLSDGDTLGRLHFDPFDNLLCQISGRKQVILFEPFDNTKLYEAHIPQATLNYNKETGRFFRRGLEDTTSMVMSPVDILNPDFKRFPRFAETFPLNCTIDEGDMLYMPAFWWHEVQSFPSKGSKERRNLAVNFWYEPFLKKEFPCSECSMDINPAYYDLLY